MTTRSRPRSRVRPRPLRRARLPRRRRSRCWAPTAAAFFNANSAHPFENPTPLSNFIEILSIFTIGSGLTYMFGKFVGDTRQGWALWAVMLILFLAGVAVVLPVEQNGNPLLESVRRRPGALEPAARRQLRRQRDALRPVCLGAVRGHHDRRVVRRGQHHAR